MPYVLGGMSAAVPGGQPSRKVLMEPLGSLFFAGEAAHETQWGTLNGAWESGERAAEGALRKIGALKPEPDATQGKKKRAAPRGETTSSAPEQRGLSWPQRN